ncbi:hypothetical protein BKA65DRAFT_577719 [Rhexocercosporidium sp. MPI-PUGE-AT-0058]|nr:hypothetical protein BKA65DRAFT_577719 [Rhexocercosporidium sp. MPI-PUGE-AT-0058]
MSSKRTTTFEPFPKLTTELRKCIWEHALPRGHLIQVFYTEIEYHSGAYSEGDLGKTTFTSNTPVPAMLLACSESRKIASKVYKLSLGTAQSPATIYLAFSLGTLYFGNFGLKHREFDASALINTFSKKDLQNIRHLAIEADTFEEHCFINLHATSDLVGLQSLKLVVES